jgi:DNA-binding response OmpR family regulator
VVVAAGGEEGLKLARKIRPLIITLDVVMPGMDGWEVLQALQQDTELAKIPVIMLTIVDNEIKASHLGASNYLVKPVDRDILTELIAKHRGTRHSAEPEKVPVSVASSQEIQMRS